MGHPALSSNWDNYVESKISEGEFGECVCRPGAGECGGAGDEAAAERGAQWDSGGARDDAGGGGKGAGGEPAQGFGAAALQLDGFSVERLMHFVTALKHDVVIEIRPRAVARGMGRISIVRAGTDRRGAVAVVRRKRVGVAALA